MIAIRVIASTLLFVPIAVTAAAQTTASPPKSATTGTSSTPGTTSTGGTTSVSGATTPTTVGPYDRLSVGNRKIARALFEAQSIETGTDTGTTTRTPLTLDEIAGMKQSGQGWGHVFKQLKAQGLVTEKSLGQVVSQYVKQQQASRSETTANRTGDDTTASSSSGTDKGERGAGVGNKTTGASYTVGGRTSGSGGTAGQGGGQGNAKSK